MGSKGRLFPAKKAGNNYPFTIRKGVTDMKINNMLLIIVLCFFFTTADDSDTKKPQKDEEVKKEQLYYEKALKAYKEDMAASERVKAQYAKEKSIKTDDSEDDNVAKNGSDTARDKKEEETQELKEEE